jgi:NADH-quinone oxidoreductase subunit E
METGKPGTAAPLPFRLPAEREARIDDLQRRYPTKQATLLPVLWELQEERGFVDERAMEYASARCDVPPAHVYSVVTFYTMYHRKPVGKHHIQVCRNISCCILGAEPIIDLVQKRLGIKPGETTGDGRFSLELVECLAGCSSAPVIQINREYHENLTLEKVNTILDFLGAP